MTPWPSWLTRWPGNFTAASKIIKRLNNLLDHPAYLASQVLENAEDGSTARWLKSSATDTVTNLNDPCNRLMGRVV